MNARLWYPQLDVYDCVRRIGALVAAYAEAPGVERLCIADFYLANPPLLHWCKMSREVRRAFSALGIARPQNAFLQYPAPGLLFGKMEPVQKEALRAMGGKGLLSMGELQRGVAVFTPAGAERFTTGTAARLVAGEERLVRFLSAEFAANAEAGALNLRRSSGLRRAV